MVHAWTTRRKLDVCSLLLCVALAIMSRDPEVPVPSGESHQLSDFARVRAANSAYGNASRVYHFNARDEVLRRRYRAGQQRTQRRIILKNGDCNILKSRILSRRLKFLQDIFTTLVDCQWRWNLLVFSLSFFVSWLIFALVWWLLAYCHGDLEDDHLPPMQEITNWNPCVLGIFGFTSCFLYSIETQTTIGYGARTITEECPEAMYIMCFQSMFAVLLGSYMGGIVVVKMTRARNRTQTLLFSKYAVISQRDDELCLMFRVGDLQKSIIIGGEVRAQLIRTKTTQEGEVISYYQTELELTADDCDSGLFFIWPVTLVHHINSDSPLYGISATDLIEEPFEIVVILEGTVESTGQTTQARSSYLTNEILWGHRFASVVSYNHRISNHQVDYSKFEETFPVDTLICSAKDIDELRAGRRENKKIEKAPLVILGLPKKSNKREKKDKSTSADVSLYRDI